MDDFEVSDTVEDVATGLAVVVTGALVRAALNRLYERRHEEPPPRDPGSPGVSWRQALAWASVVGVTVAVTKVATRRALPRR